MSLRPTDVREAFARYDHAKAMRRHPPDLEAAADAQASFNYELGLRENAQSNGHVMRAR